MVQYMRGEVVMVMVIVWLSELDKTSQMEVVTLILNVVIAYNFVSLKPPDLSAHNLLLASMVCLRERA